jgi:hypothetical protein
MKIPLLAKLNKYSRIFNVVKKQLYITIGPHEKNDLMYPMVLESFIIVKIIRNFIAKILTNYGF